MRRSEFHEGITASAADAHVLQHANEFLCERALAATSRLRHRGVEAEAASTAIVI